MSVRTYVHKFYYFTKPRKLHVLQCFQSARHPYSVRPFVQGNLHPHITHGCLDPPDSASKTVSRSRSVQPFWRIVHGRKFPKKLLIFCMIGCRSIENVDQWPHNLGHIISTNLNDQADILYRRNCFIGEVNNVLCIFGQLVSFMNRLFKVGLYCSSFSGCEMWDLDNKQLNG